MLLLGVSDPHITDKLKDDHRNDLFPQTEHFIEQYKPDAVLLCGDITHEIDHHSAVTVNRVIKGLASWARLCPVWVVMGNHDLKDEISKLPYFDFANEIPNVRYFVRPTILEEFGEKFVLLPHTRDPQTDWMAFAADIQDPRSIIFAHVAVNDCISETGQKLKSSTSSEIFNQCKRAFSGDIHKQQVVGPLTYIGSPYPTSFGDNDFKGRGILYDSVADKITDLTYDFPRRLTFTIESLDDFKRLAEEYLVEKDQIKIKLVTTRENVGTERKIITELQQMFANSEAQLVSLVQELAPEMTPEKITNSEGKTKIFSDFDSYCGQNNVAPEIKALCEQIIKEVDNNEA